MELYEKICPLGEGTYGMVMKCKHKETHQIVAIKKFKDSEEDPQIRKTAMREVKMLKNLRHDNVVALLEVFRRKGKLYLVFEHIDRTILADIESHQNGIPDDPSKGDFVRKSMYQLLRGVDFLHAHHVMHRDLKPENILVSKSGVIKLCDFGFARGLTGVGGKYTDYVATRWYRAPELLVGDVQYGVQVDVWAIGCIFAELLSSQPLFPGDTDLDQLYRIMKYIGPLTRRFTELFQSNPYYVNNKIPEVKKPASLQTRFSFASKEALQLLLACLHHEPQDRPSCSKLLQMSYFTRDTFVQRYDPELKKLLDIEREAKIPKLKKKEETGNLQPLVPLLPLPARKQENNIPIPVKKTYEELHPPAYGSNQFTSNPIKPTPFFTSHLKTLHANNSPHTNVTSNTTGGAVNGTEKGKYVNARPLEFSLPKIHNKKP